MLMLLLLSSRTSSGAASQTQNASKWWFLNPVTDDVQLNTLPNGSMVMQSGVLAFHFEMRSGSVMLSHVNRFRCTEPDCDSDTPFWTFPGEYTPPGPNHTAVPFDSMATIDVEHQKTYLGWTRPSLNIPDTAKWIYEGHTFVQGTIPRFHWVPGRHGTENISWPPEGASLHLHFSFQCANVWHNHDGSHRDSSPNTSAPGGNSTDTLHATLTYEMYAAMPTVIKRMNITNNCADPVFLSDKLFEMPSHTRAQSYSQYITFKHAPAFAFQPGQIYEAPYTFSNLDTGKKVEKFHFQRMMEPQRFENLLCLGIWDPWQAGIVSKGIIPKAWFPDVMQKSKSLIDEAHEAGFEAVMYQTDHMGGGDFDGQPIPMWLQYASPDPNMIARVKTLSDYAHSKGLEFYIYKGDQAMHFNWTQDWMEIQAPGEKAPFPTSNGFCAASQWAETFFDYEGQFLDQTGVDGSACDYCWIIGTINNLGKGVQRGDIGCSAANHSHAKGAGQWESVNWWIKLTKRNFARPMAMAK